MWEPVGEKAAPWLGSGPAVSRRGVEALTSVPASYASSVSHTEPCDSYTSVEPSRERAGFKVPEPHSSAVKVTTGVPLTLPSVLVTRSVIRNATRAGGL